MKEFRISQGSKRIVVNASAKVEIRVGDVSKEIDAAAILAAPRMADAIAANAAEVAKITQEFTEQLTEKDKQITELHNRMAMMAVVFKSMTSECQFEKRGDKWVGLYYVKPKNEAMELAFNMAMTVEAEQAFIAYMNQSER